MRIKLLSIFVFLILVAGCTSLTSGPKAIPDDAAVGDSTGGSAEALPSGINEDVSELNSLDEELALEGEEISVEELESIDF